MLQPESPLPFVDLASDFLRGDAEVASVSPMLARVTSLLSGPFLASIIFSCVMFVSLIQFFYGRAWYLWTLMLAAIIESAGFIAFAIHTQQQTNHSAFLASFITITIAPIFLTMANITTLTRLVERIAPTEQHLSGKLWIRAASNTFVLTVALVGLALPFIGLGLYDMARFLSPEPIDGYDGAVERLHYYEHGLRFLLYGQLMQLSINVIFSVVAATFTLKTAQWEVDAHNAKGKDWKRLLHAVNTVSGLLMVRAVYATIHLAQVNSSQAELGGTSGIGWLCDALPMLFAVVIFCFVRPSSYLPRDTPRTDPEPPSVFGDEKLVLIGLNDH